jgi:uncharacterized phiE125 gp8 family phage protein
MKNHLKIESDMTEDDGLIASLSAAARDVAETWTGSNVPRHRVMVATSFDLTMTDFPGCGYIAIPRVPLVSVTSITYVDTAGTTQTLASSVYSVDTAQGVIYLAYGQVWPSTRADLADRVTVRFIAGMMAPFTAASTDTCTVSGRTFATGDRLRLLNTGGYLPSGLLKTPIDYFVISASGATFSLSLTSGGSAVDILSDGNGTHFAGTEVAGFETLRTAMKFLVAHWYRNREAVVVGTITSTLPIAVEALIMAQHA